MSSGSIPTTHTIAQDKLCRLPELCQENQFVNSTTNTGVENNSNPRKANDRAFSHDPIFAYNVGR